MRRALVALLVALALPMSVSCGQTAADKESPLDGFQKFWSAFRQAALAGDKEKVASMTGFPFKTRGPLDSDPVRTHDRAAFLGIFHKLLEEDPGLSREPETMRRFKEDEVPWCSSFVNWVMTKAGYKGTNSALAKSWLDWGTPLTSPREGAITVIKRKTATSDAATGSATGFHVAFYVSSTGTHIRLLGGNQADSVRYSNFSLNSYEVRGNRWPY